MRAALLRCGLIVTAAATFLGIGCEKHYVGEYPEVQRDRLAEAKSAHRENDAAPTATPTPANFFPEKKSP